MVVVVVVVVVVDVLVCASCVELHTTRLFASKVYVIAMILL